jgi:cyclophilin family peptidyl-prolyl cis-trans isomerase
MMSVKVLLLCFVVFAMVTGTARAANPVVAVETNVGTFEIELFEDKAPITVKNFLKYVEDKHYDGTIFHRVIPTFMIQGGGFEPGMKEKKTRDPIKNESSNGLSNLKYTIAMARLGRDVGNVKAADSATAQFFINVKDNTFLDKAKAADGAGYCVFGRVIKGTDVVDKIKAVETDTIKGFDDVPTKDVVIKSVKVIKPEKK